MDKWIERLAQCVCGVEVGGRIKGERRKTSQKPIRNRRAYMSIYRGGTRAED